MISYIVLAVLIFLILRDFEGYYAKIFPFFPLLSCFSVYTAYSVLDFWGVSAFVILVVKRRQLLRNLKQLPVKTGFLLLSVTLLVSSFIQGGTHWLYFVKELLETITVVVIYLLIIQNSQSHTIRNTLKSILIFSIIIGIYSLYEISTNTNPFVSFCESQGLYSEETLIESIRYGIKRSQGLFTMHITNGAVSMVFALILIYFKINSKLLQPIIKNNTLFVFIITLLIATVLFTGSRACIIGLFIGLLSFSKNVINNSRFLFVCLLFVIIAGIMGFDSYIQEIINSITDTNAVGGSNEDDRLIQFQTAFMFWYQNFWFGNGLLACYENVMPMHPELLGAESLWMPILIDYGFLGLFTYLYFFVASIRIVYNANKSLVFIVLALWVTNTLTSIPSFPITAITGYLVLMCYAKNNNKSISYD